ncbi:glycine--tRNA ligase subunit beta [Tuanshanicoccus yangjingiae]|nr:glycine--tRNA ligase subunit beta [Facklamia sp. 252]NEW68123.1 glycine--tRNA ligase subunit beta [Facklamia sp. 253]QQD66520.1 glycine--tRNA ligase subunit beta [Aerococcaceae bacterium zg-252]
MSKQYLLEIGLEEIPARFLQSLSLQLKERVEQFLQAERIEFENITPLSTPRRLSVIVDGLAEKQEDVSEVAKGPAMKIAKDEAGNWSKAALGFLRGQGATPEDSFVESIKGVEYLHVKKFIPGQPVESVLAKLPQVIQAMTFPVTMHWNQIETSFIRPIHWIVSLLDSEVVPFEFVGVTADRLSRGHRFLGHDVLIQSPATYVEQLKQEFVMVDFVERQAVIKAQIEDLAANQQWVVPIDADLLEEVTAIVEWPTVFYGEFETNYLEVPEQVLITAMRDHQRYFYATDKTGKLLPYFISVRNGNAEHLEQVIKGNRKVLRARLEDALFFYKEDLKRPLSYYLEKLEHVNEHFKLGSLAAKQRRIGELILMVADAIHADEQAVQDAVAASQVYKYDLMTQTVGEFDELQGEIGAVYAEHFGLSSAVATAIKEQYLPKSSGGALPTATASQLLAVADKLDTLIHYFKVELIPTGSNDPYALRRQATGIVEIVLANQWKFDLNALLLQHPLVKNDEPLLAALQEFFKARIAVALEREHIDYDIIQAVIANKQLVLTQMVQTATQLQAKKAQEPEQYRQIVEAITRVVNLGAKAEVAAIDVDLAQTVSETALINYALSLGLGNVIDVLQQLVNPIQAYFEENMVNAEDDAIRQNRLATMRTLTDYVLDYMDPRQLISKF